MMKTMVKSEIGISRLDMQEYTVAYFYFTPLFVDIQGILLTQKLHSYDGTDQGLLITRMSFAEARDLGRKLLDAAGDRK